LPGDEPKFLTAEDVRQLRELSIERHGGTLGVRDEGLLESAVLMPQQGFGGHLFHPTLEAMAAAYLFHLCLNHPFIDGNKRTALLACETFLRLNGKELTFDNREAEEIALRIAAGALQKEELTRLIEENVRNLQN
jgi:death-on-curing protein